MTDLLVVPTLGGLPSILKPFTVSGFVFMFFVTIFATLPLSKTGKLNDRWIFWCLGVALVIVTAAAPAALSRDGLGYVRDIVPNACGFRSCNPADSQLRDSFWYGSITFLLGLVSNERAALYLAALGLLIKLYVIDRLCKSKVLALMLLVPLVYVQYDFTQLRTGFAISWYFLGIYFLVRKWFVASVPVVGTCFLWHMQALPSISLFPAYWLNRSKLVVPIVILIVFCLLALGVYPKARFLVSVYTPGIGAESYMASALSGEFYNMKALPLGYIPILIGATFILSQSAQPEGLFRAVGSSIVVGAIFAWFFAANPAIQGRIFEFYMAPLVLAAGNVSDNTLKKTTVLALSWILYVRLELFNDWILG